MSKESDYLGINKNTWNNKVDLHMRSNFYDVNGFLNGKSTLNAIELALLGDVSNKTILHLQCHFGMDTISLSRLGATATGVDFSDKAIDEAQKLARKTNSDTKFICCDVYDLQIHLNQKFDIVFTSYGTIGWLPDLDKWAKIIAAFLKPGGRFVFAEFHPVVWMFDDQFEKIKYRYFQDAAIIETESGTYADTSANLTTESVCWNHSTGDVLTSLLNNGLTIESFSEYDFSPYDCFSRTVESEPGKFRIAHLDNKIPMTFSLSATK